MDTHNIFEEMAGRYDNEERIRHARKIADGIRSHIKDATGKKAMDYGCGTGLVGLELVDFFDTILFVDSSAGMIEQIDGKLEHSGIKNAQTMCLDILSDDAPVQVDYIILSQVLLHVKDTELLLGRLYSALNDGGSIIIADFDKDESIVSEKVHNGFDQQELIKLAKRVGFASADAHTFYHGEKMFMNKDASMFLLMATK